MKLLMLLLGLFAVTAHGHPGHGSDHWIPHAVDHGVLYLWVLGLVFSLVIFLIIRHK